MSDHGSDTDPEDERGLNGHTEFSLSNSWGSPNNTGGLGTMTPFRWYGDDPNTRVACWQDDVNLGLWVSTPVANSNEEAMTRLPNGEQIRWLYLLDPVLEFYEPLGRVPNPAEAHVTNGHGEIILTTCPMLLRVCPRDVEGFPQRALDVQHHRTRFYESLQTMRHFDFDMDDDIHLWRDDMTGGIWKSKNGMKYGWLERWEGQSEDGPWNAPFPSAIDPTIFYEPAIILADPADESWIDRGNGELSLFSHTRGDVYESRSYKVPYFVARTVNRHALGEEERREMTANDPETLLQTIDHQSYESEGEGSSADSEPDSVFDEQ